MNSVYLCTWCGETLKDSEIQDNGTICKLCAKQIAETSSLFFDELYALPYGVITLNEHGIITSYNQWEQNLSGKSANEVIGKNFFTEIAPCTKVKEFAGRFTEFLTSGQRIETFDFTFPFPQFPVNMSIVFVKPQDEIVSHRITVLVKRA
jgi:photoactive yellow protein